LQSFQGKYQSIDFYVSNFEAKLVNGSTKKLPSGGVSIYSNHESAPRGKTDFIPVMNNVNIFVSFDVPDDQELDGALVDLTIGGDLSLITGNQYNFSGSFPYTVRFTFRISGKQEAIYWHSYDEIAGHLHNYQLYAFAVSFILACTTCIFRSKILFAPKPPDPLLGDAGALIWASRFGYLNVAKNLIEKGINPDVKDNDGLTPLMYASVRGHVKIVDMLLRNGSNVSTISNNGQTALGLVNNNDKLDAFYARKILLLLVKNGADPNVSAADGTTPLMRATRWGDKVLAQALIENGANVNPYV
jgi:hypothetical protein